LDFLLPIWNPLIVEPLVYTLQFLANLTGNGGLAIVLMTLIIKTFLLPLSLKQTASMKAMQSLQPELAALKKKYKERERVTQETMKLYKERGINPASGCLPMIPMMVVLFGLYWALMNLAQADPEFQRPFLWVPKLHEPDVINLGDFPLPGILPILMAITQFFSSKMMTMPSQDPQQQMMNRMMTIMMPGMMLFWGVTFPAGLVLYWLISNIYEMVRLYFTMGPESLRMGSFSFGSLVPGRQAAEDVSEIGGDGARPSSQDTGGETPGSGVGRTNGRPSRPRRKRGRRSGRR
jgi:YidC/Oxa1 family membrane protein insertase